MRLPLSHERLYSQRDEGFPGAFWKAHSFLPERRFGLPSYSIARRNEILLIEPRMNSGRVGLELACNQKSVRFHNVTVKTRLRVLEPTLLVTLEQLLIKITGPS